VSDLRNVALEAAIDRDPYDSRSYLVYGDWLQEQGDPRGELIAMQIAGEGDPRIAVAARAFLQRHGERFIGGLAPDSWVWRDGFIRYAALGTYGPANHDALPALLEHPSARFLPELAIGFSDFGLQPAIDTLAERLRPALRVLELGAGDPVEHAMLHDIGDLERLWPVVPRLSRLTICGQNLTLGELDLPALSRLELWAFSLSAENVRSIAQARWPELAALSIRCRRAAQPILSEFRTLLEHTQLPRLTRLGLICSDFVDELVDDSFAALPLLRQLRSLDLSHGHMTDVGAERLARHADAFAHLEVLDVSQNRLTAAGIHAVAGIAKRVISDNQNDADDAQIDDLYDY